MELKTYKKIDLGIFMFLACLFEVVNFWACIGFGNDALAYFTFTIVISLIAMFRWGISGLLIAPIAGFVGSLMNTIYTGFNITTYLTYVIGNSFIILSYLYLIKIGRTKVKENSFLLVVYLLIGYISVIIGRNLILSIFTGFNLFFDNLSIMVIPEAIGLLVSLFVIFIANKKNGILVEMISYIRGVQKEKEEDKLNLKELKENDHYDNIEEVTLEGNYNDMTLLEGGTPDAKQLKELQEMFDHSSKNDLKEGD